MHCNLMRLSFILSWMSNQMFRLPYCLNWCLTKITWWFFNGQMLQFFKGQVASINFLCLILTLPVSTQQLHNNYIPIYCTGTGKSFDTIFISDVHLACVITILPSSLCAWNVEFWEKYWDSICKKWSFVIYTKLK